MVTLARLRQTISNNGLFEANAVYPPDPSLAQDYTLNVLGDKDSIL
jgi:hypothetical protein